MTDPTEGLRIADGEESFLLAYVSRDTKIIGIEHPTEANWQDVYAAHVALRDRLNERLAQADFCPIKPARIITDALAEKNAQIAELLAERDNPQVVDFTSAVALEAMHQRARWGSDHDAGKTPFDWFWLIGYLAQKAADAAVRGDIFKAQHHTISTAAALANWHTALGGGDDAMRPGIMPSEEAQARAALEGAEAPQSPIPLELKPIHFRLLERGANSRYIGLSNNSGVRMGEHAALGQLMRAGLVRFTEDSQPPGPRMPTPCEITDAGRAALNGKGG